MPPTHPERQSQLIALANHDATVRAELAATGELFHGYHPKMESVHITNARALEPLLANGWPSATEIGEDGQYAAWLIVQHAISLPSFMRPCRDLLEAAVQRGEAPGWQLAKLSDRILTLEGKPQRYGTQFDWDDNGEVAPLPIEDITRVDELRAQVGLEPLAETTARQRRNVEENGERPPLDREAHRALAHEWAQRVGWR